MEPADILRGLAPPSSLAGRALALLEHFEAADREVSAAVAAGRLSREAGRGLLYFLMPRGEVTALAYGSHVRELIGRCADDPAVAAAAAAVARSRVLDAPTWGECAMFLSRLSLDAPLARPAERAYHHVFRLAFPEEASRLGLPSDPLDHAAHEFLDGLRVRLDVGDRRLRAGLRP